MVTVKEMAEWLTKAVNQGHGDVPLVVGEYLNANELYRGVIDLIYDAADPVRLHKINSDGIAEEDKTVVLVIQAVYEEFSRRPGQF